MTSSPRVVLRQRLGETSSALAADEHAAIRAALTQLLALDPQTFEDFKDVTLRDLARIMASPAAASSAPRIHPVPASACISSLESLLTAREMQVVLLVCEGLTNKQIGRSLGLSDKTIKNHISKVLKKTNLSARTQIAVYALRAGVM